jgi:RHS repeat-associated protein
MLTNSRVFNNSRSALNANPTAGPVNVASTEVFGHHNPGEYTILLPANSGGNLGAGINLHDNTYNFITLHGTVSADVSLSPPPGGVYLVSGSITVNSGARLAIPPGSELRIQNGLTVSAGGRLEANGTPTGPVRLTNFGGSFSGLHINGGVATLSHTLVENSASFGVNVDPDGELSVTNSLIANNTQWGLRVWSAARPVVIRNSSFVGNGSGAVYHQGFAPGAVVQASSNYWGSGSGPTHASNPGGTGQAVMNGVAFEPFSPAFTVPGDGRLSGWQVSSNANPLQAQAVRYDAIGQVSSLSSRGYVTYTLDYAYNAAGRLVSRTPAQGATSPSAPLSYGFTYDDADQLTQLGITNAQTAAALLILGYSYDAAGNITGITSSRDGAATYTYDALNRLASVSSPGFNAAYAYDAAGNRTQAGNITYTYDAGGRLVSASDGTTYTYDANGNLKTRTKNGQTTTFTWDGQSRLVRIDYPGGTFSQYTYDDSGRRTSKRLPDGSMIYYVYAGDLLMQELDGSGAVVASYTYDGLDRPVSLWRGGEAYYYLLDHLGSVLGLADASGSVVATYRYDPWGNLINNTGSVENPLRFTGREYDAESGLYFYRARYYDPQAGRFISRDPIGLLGGINTYSYVKNDPLANLDPFGNKYWAVGFQAGAALGGGAEIGIGVVIDPVGWDVSSYVSVGYGFAEGGSAGVGLNIAAFNDADMFWGWGHEMGINFPGEGIGVGICEFGSDPFPEGSKNVFDAEGNGFAITPGISVGYDAHQYVTYTSTVPDALSAIGDVIWGTIRSFLP